MATLGVSVEGQLHTYSGGGYTSSSSGKLPKAQGILALQNTRGIFVEMSLYNAQVNYFAVVQLTIEIPAEGFLLPSSWVEAVRLIKYQDTNGGATRIFEFLYIAYAILSFIAYTYFYASNVVKAFETRPDTCNPIIIQRTLGLVLARMKYFLVGVLAISSVVAFCLRQTLKDFAATNGNVYIDLAKQRDLELAFTFCLAGVVFFVACKMIKILRFAIYRNKPPVCQSELPLLNQLQFSSICYVLGNVLTHGSRPRFSSYVCSA
ncbi:unnamed protein product [Heligmosomoides polygyrus]|uniref:PKD_channel domain-containing protein n=1 Tax=Heligmosomoides polygyrus TaxID=6339 RepID=A0A183GXA7_HELPZ|nr:unnamed protein product [Heligmosomoides polygyrus]